MQRAIATAMQIWHRFTLTRYLAASVIALVADVAVFSLLRMVDIYVGFAGVAGYCVGIVVHWSISSKFVFVGRAKEGEGTYLQQALFAGSALLGLAITFITISLLSHLGFTAFYAKSTAVGLSFFAVFITREFGVFK